MELGRDEEFVVRITRDDVGWVANSADPDQWEASDPDINEVLAEVADAITRGEFPKNTVS